jgi:hypothetical protein
MTVRSTDSYFFLRWTFWTSSFQGGLVIWEQRETSAHAATIGSPAVRAASRRAGGDDYAFVPPAAPSSRTDRPACRLC